MRIRLDGFMRLGTTSASTNLFVSSCPIDKGYVLEHFSCWIFILDGN